MKHAIMVMGFGKPNVLQKTINILDDLDIDFIIHWDKKYKIPNLTSKYSNIVFLKDRIKVHWGTDTQTIVERKLMEYVVNSDSKYEYVHLISSSDIPLMTADYFKLFFRKNSYYIGFMDYLEKPLYDRMKYYYPIRNLNVKHNFFLIKIFKKINILLGIDRLKNERIEKGCNWFSMDIRFVKEIVSYNNFNIFKNTLTGDEFYIQTILKKLKPKNIAKKYNYFSDEYRMTKSSSMASRYINWFRGRPYTFQLSDCNELKRIVNTDYAFTRKIENENIIDYIFKL